MTFGKVAWRRQITDRGRRLWVTSVAAMFAAGLSGVGFAVTPAVVVHAGSVTCSWPAYYDENTGPQFEDGTVPHSNVYINVCNGGQPTGCQGCFNYDDNTWRQYRYQITLDTTNGGSGSESDITEHSRAWACGNPSWDQLKHTQNTDEVDTSWFNYGNQYNSCGYQYDWQVVVTTWQNERWSKYTNDQRATCIEQCPTG
jgi:hypothetical protein